MNKDKYPKLTDDDFYEKISNLYKKYKIQKKKMTIDQYCNPKEFTLQLPQQFLPDYIGPETPYKSILIYHRIGAGKTCAAIQIAEKWKSMKRIVFVLPAFLKGNLKSELRSLCGRNNYMTPSERLKLSKLSPSDTQYKELINKSDERIKKYYDIYSYNKFIDNVKNKTINLNKSILIIDEIQNMVSEKGSYYTLLYDLIHRSSADLRVILLSATPMFDRPREIALTLNLLNPSPDMPIGKMFDKMFLKENTKSSSTYYSMKNINKFKKMIKGKISFYMGAPAFTFPEMIIKYVECEMSSFQFGVYKKMLDNKNISFDHTTDASDLPKNFYLGARFISNIIFPNKKIDQSGIKSFTPDKIKSDLAKYSCKLDRIVSKIKKKGKAFIYSGFKEYAGLKTIAHVLDAMGYKNYLEHGPGKKRYAVWSGDVSTEKKDEIREVYNRTDNLYGDKIKIIMGCPSIKEGVSLKAVRYVHILEPYWNISRIEQVIGRASRYCSHINLPEDERTVKVYVYVAVHTSDDNYQTIDQYIKKLSETKHKIIKEFEQAIAEGAVDCRLNQNANTINGQPINCE